ncbi:MAG: glycosyltransferase [Eggerthellaceae bacterium]|nr:glycosyltransferase [Eggerthellaceae bacterium]
MPDYIEKISVIVPAYNAEAHLCECFDSISKQPRVGEIIIVDDGSSDGTLKLAEKLALEDARVTVLHQDNSGVSVARNTGMAAVTLPWMAFVDADDVVPRGAFDALLAEAETDGADMTYGNFAILKNGEVFDIPNGFADRASGRIPTRDMIASLANASRDSVSGSCWRVLFRTSFVERTRQEFPAGISMSEDYCFMLKLLVENPVVAYVDRVVYLVRREGRSATQCYMPNLERSMDYVNGVLRQACEGDDLLVRSYWDCVANTAWHACGTVFKEGTPYASDDRRCEVNRIMRKYGNAISQISVLSDLGCGKALVLKIGCMCPWALWAVLEAKNSRLGGGR